MYLLMNSQSGQALMNEEREKMLGAQVKVKGMLVRGKGLQAIYVEGMEKMKSEEKEKGEQK